MDKKILEILVCPQCKGKLEYKATQNELWCRAEKFAFPIREEIPVMLIEEARQISLEELDRG